MRSVASTRPVAPWSASSSSTTAMTRPGAVASARRSTILRDRLSAAPRAVHRAPLPCRDRDPGEHTLGRTVVDWSGRTGKAPTAMVIDGIDGDGFFAMLTERLARLPLPGRPPSGTGERRAKGGAFSIDQAASWAAARCRRGCGMTGGNRERRRGGSMKVSRKPREHAAQNRPTDALRPRTMLEGCFPCRRNPDLSQRPVRGCPCPPNPR